MKKAGMFKTLVEQCQGELTTGKALRNIEIPLSGTSNQRNYYRRQLAEYREFNRGMYELGRATEDEFTETLKLEYVLEKSIDSFVIEGV